MKEFLIFYCIICYIIWSGYIYSASKNNWNLLFMNTFSKIVHLLIEILLLILSPVIIPFKIGIVLYNS